MSKSTEVDKIKDLYEGVQFPIQVSLHSAYWFWRRFLIGVVEDDRPGLEVIELEYSLNLKIKPNDMLLAQAANHSKQPIIASSQS